MKRPDLHAINGEDRPPDAPFARPSICLISALTVADFIDPDLITEAHANTGAQLGILTLAAILREQGFHPHVVNLDDLFYDFIRRDQVEPTEGKSLNGGTPANEQTGPGPDPSEFFFPFVARHLRLLSFDIYGFSSICSSYPLTLRLALETKRLKPETRVILGGPAGVRRRSCHPAGLSVHRCHRARRSRSQLPRTLAAARQRRRRLGRCSGDNFQARERGDSKPQRSGY